MTDPKDLYLDLLKLSVSNMIYGRYEEGFDPEQRLIGRDVAGGKFPPMAKTMIGLKRLDNIRFCVESVLKNHIPGDLIETGVWRGGATIFMRGILKAYGVTDRKVWVADSFAGVPPPDPRFEEDRKSAFHWAKKLAISREEVTENFRLYDLLDDQVVFLEGLFKDTLPMAPIDQLAVLRLDGDIYSSTMDALVNLYPKLSLGGFVIIDDYNILMARNAVHYYRDTHGIEEGLRSIDGTAVFWQKKAKEIPGKRVVRPGLYDVSGKRIPE